MGLRLREKPDHVYELFIELNREQLNNDVVTVSKFPESIDDDELLTSVPQFAFPISSEFHSNSVDLFTFVLTDIRGEFRFGFCRHSSGSTKCLCVVSYFPWFETFYRFLNLVAELSVKSDGPSLIRRLLKRLYGCRVPNCGTVTEVCRETEAYFKFTRPMPDDLPSIPESRNLTEYYNAVGTQTMVELFASMLFERRILVTSKKLSRMTACIHAAVSLMYPMMWQHLYIPAMPAHLLEYGSAPMPYVIGVHSSLFEKARNNDLGDAVLLDADTGVVMNPHNDLQSFPPEVLRIFRKHMKLSKNDKLFEFTLLGDGISKTYLEVMACLLGGYRDGLRFQLGQPLEFSEERFIASRPSTMQPFLKTLIRLQSFEQFIANRIESINSTPTSYRSRFDIEAIKYSEVGSAEHAKEKKTKPEGKYWMGDVKVQGKKAVKEILHCIEAFKAEGREDSLDGLQSLSISSPYMQSVPPLRPSTLNMSALLGPSPLPRQSRTRRRSYDSNTRQTENTGKSTRFYSIMMAAENGRTSVANGCNSDILEQEESLYSNWQQLHSSRSAAIEAGELFVDGRFRILDSFRRVGEGGCGVTGKRTTSADDILMLTSSSDPAVNIARYGGGSGDSSSERRRLTDGSMLDDESTDELDRQQSPLYSDLHDLEVSLCNSSAVSSCRQKWSRRRDSGLTCSSEDELTTSRSTGSIMEEKSADRDDLSADSGILLSEQSAVSPETAAAGKRIVYLPRSSSSISRKKAFYNAPRPNSLRHRNIARQKGFDEGVELSKENDKFVSEDEVFSKQASQRSPLFANTCGLRNDSPAGQSVSGYAANEKASLFDSTCSAAGRRVNSEPSSGCVLNECDQAPDDISALNSVVEMQTNSVQQSTNSFADDRYVRKCLSDQPSYRSDVTDITAADSELLPPTEQLRATEQEAVSVDKRVVNLPRSSSSISRKKAFYKASRPESLRFNQIKKQARINENEDIKARAENVDSTAEDISDSCRIQQQPAVGMESSNSKQFGDCLESTVDSSSEVDAATVIEAPSPVGSISSPGIYSPLGFKRLSSC